MEEPTLTRADQTSGSAPIAAILELLRQRCPEAEYVHALRVASGARDNATRLVALAHDLVEDGYATWDEIERALNEYAGECLPALKLLTRTGEPYEDYIAAIGTSGNRIALTVKALDLLDHLSPALWPTLREDRIDRYVEALRIVTINGRALAR